MERRNLLILLFAVLIVVIFVSVFYSRENRFVGNKAVLNEIDRLLLPVSNGSINGSDFSLLKKLARNDRYASGEVDELILLANHGEYSHVGHGLGFLYEYSKTGKVSICPGHSLSHYYVFLRDGENSSAQDNLNDAGMSLQKWESVEESHGPSYLNENNYSFYKTLIENSIGSIKSGNNSISNESISNLADAPCVY